MLHHGAEAAAGQRFVSAEALALYRLNALDAQVKGALEHGALRLVAERPRRSRAGAPMPIGSGQAGLSRCR